MEQVIFMLWVLIGQNILHSGILIAGAVYALQSNKAASKQRNQQSNEGVMQTHLLERIDRRLAEAYRPTVESDRVQRIVSALEKSGAYNTTAQRSNLLLALPAALSGTIERQDNTRGELLQVVQRAVRWDDDGKCLDEMLDKAIFYLGGVNGGSQAAKDLQRIRDEVSVSVFTTGNGIQANA